jgi:hypothetical protein
VAVADQFLAIQAQLPADWQEAHLRLTIPDEGDCARAAALLAPTNPGRRGKVIHFLTGRRNTGVTPERIRSLLRRLDTAGITGTLELADVHSVGEPAAPAEGGLAAAWDAEVAALPADWSDVYAEVELTSSDHIEPAALRLSPLNPTRPGTRPVVRFRAARKFGYGASPEMARRCLERLDEAGIRGTLRILHVLSDTYPVKTQGPVWYVGGKVV